MKIPEIKDTLSFVDKMRGKVLEDKPAIFVAICIDNTWRNSLTIGKEYEVLRTYEDPNAGYQMVEIKCDDGKIRSYRASRFTQKL